MGLFCCYLFLFTVLFPEGSWCLVNCKFLFQFIGHSLFAGYVFNFVCFLSCYLFYLFLFSGVPRALLEDKLGDPSPLDFILGRGGVNNGVLALVIVLLVVY